jgi:hypothetical protein
MSIVSNYKYSTSGDVKFIGDYKTYKGTASLLRSYSMLKSKSFKYRFCKDSNHCVGVNNPITKNYKHKVDFIKAREVVQGFWSLNPILSDDINYVDKTVNNGFVTIKSYSVLLQNYVGELLRNKMKYFSSMLSKSNLGEYIHIANQENFNKANAAKFLELTKGL